MVTNIRIENLLGPNDEFVKSMCNSYGDEKFFPSKRPAIKLEDKGSGQSTSKAVGFAF